MTLTTALRTASTLLAATSATVMMDTLWTLLICIPAMVYIYQKVGYRYNLFAKLLCIQMLTTNDGVRFPLFTHITNVIILITILCC